MNITVSKPNLLRTLLTAMLFIVISGCSSIPETNEVTTIENLEQEDAISASVSAETDWYDNAKQIKEQLYVQYRQWQGIPYRLGGLSKNGIDCSGFVYLTYRDRLGIQMPRTTERQSKSGEEISKEQLRPGDLVFFKTGRNTRHVGIFLEDDKFIHASTKKGVMISTLNDYYWQDKYWHSRRLQH
ncbi:NlpC/P60 family protein [Thalassotalea litorea]|uniref:NlpC/P60 family protein n=1 Tax=Thalassotalea litorea TaxID=2020715 RepID=UPI0037357CEA